MDNSPRVALGAVLCAVLMCSVPGTAGATQAPPNWSGLNVVDYSGPIPTTHGTPISSVPLDRSLVKADFPQSSSAIRYLYSTVDQFGAPAVSTAAMYTPAGTAPAGGWPVVAWPHGTVGLGDDCTPSARTLNPGLKEEAHFVSTLLDDGFAIVATDYVGQGTPGPQAYLHAESEGRNTVDSVRAARQLDDSLSNKWSVVGFSQGGGAAMGTSSEVGTYDPQLAHDLVGTVSIAGPAGIENLMPLFGPHIPFFDLGILNPRLSLYISLTLTSIRSHFPEMNIDSYLTPLGRSLVDQASTVCLTDPSNVGAFESVILGDMFSKPLVTIPDFIPKVQKYLASPTTGFTGPVLVMQGLVDKDVPITQSNAITVPQIKANGYNVQLRTYPQYDHGAIIDNSAPEVAAYLSPLFGR